MDDRLTGPEDGFTLIELLVSIAILSVLAVGVTFVAARDKPAKGDAERFLDLYAMTRQLAVQGQERLGLAISPRGIQGLRRTSEGWEGSGPEIRWQERVSFVSERDRRAGAGPEIVFLSNGQTSAFSITFGSAPAITCSSDGWQGVTC